MLGQLFNEVILPHVDSEVAVLAQARQRFVAEMIRNRAQPATWLGKVLNSQWLQKIDVQEIMARLGASHYGDARRAAMNRVDGELADSVLHDVAHKFESFGSEASEHFERRARLTSVLMALVLAWCVNVNPYELLKTYLTDHDGAARVIDLEKIVTERYQQASQVKQTADKANDGAAAPQPSTAAGANPSKDKPVTNQDTDATKAAEEANASANKAKNDLGVARDATSKAITELNDLGVPIGWTEARLKAVDIISGSLLQLPVPKTFSVKSLTAMFWLLIGGLLIGLGGPFWFDA